MPKSPASKVCRRCGEEKSVDGFSSRDGGTRRGTCRACVNESKRDLKPDAAAGLLAFASGDERTAADALLAHGSVAAAAAALGWEAQRLRSTLTELKRAAARRGHAPEHSMTATVPDGYHVKGVSTLYGADGNVRQQWVKSKRDEEHRLELLFDAVKHLADGWDHVAAPTPAPATLDDDLLCVYPMGDPHLGMFSWAAETGQDFDLKIAESNLVRAVDHLVALAPPAKHALLINLGDFFHADSPENRTARSGHALDVDTRWPKVLQAGVRTMHRLIDRALEKHEHVTVINEIGNHDDNSAIMLALCLAAWYRDEPRVTIDTSPAKFHWYRFGDNLIGVTHGDTVKASALPGIMACDQAKAWGETTHRHWYCGHVHHDSVKEFPGVKVETMRTLAPRDAWHNAAGYRSERDMKLDVWHRTDGLTNRHVVGIRQLWR